MTEEKQEVSSSFPDPATLTPQERLERVNQFRLRAARNEEMSSEEIQYAMRLLATQRQSAVSVGNPSRSKKQKDADSKGAQEAAALFADL